MTYKEKNWDQFDSNLKASTANLPEPPNPYTASTTSPFSRSTNTSIRPSNTLPTPADQTSVYKNYQISTVDNVSTKSNNAYDIKPVNNDFFATPASLPTDDQYFNTLNNQAFNIDQSLNPFNTFSANKALSLINCFIPSFTPPSIPIISDILNINIFDLFLKQQSVLPKVSSIINLNIGEFLTGTLTSYFNTLLSPFTDFLGKISNCFKND